MISVAKYIILIGLGIALLGAFLWFFGKAGIFPGRLLGDISVAKEKVSFHFPVMTCIVVSIVLTVLINVLLWIFRK